MLKTVYVETTVVSAYGSNRKDAGSVYRRDITFCPKLLSPVIISPDGLWIEDLA